MIISGKGLFLFGFVLQIQSATGQIVELTPLYNTVGVKVSNIGAAFSCQVEYKPLQKDDWRLAYNPDRVSINGENQFRGSIFMLEEGTQYEVKVTINNASGPTVLPTVKTTTLISPSFFPTSNIKWVSPNGTGNYTQNNPGDLTMLFSSGQVSCGTTIMLKDGVYKTKDLQLYLNSDCTENTPIILMAEPGASPTIDASSVISTTWSLHSTVAGLYSTLTPPGTSHSNICVIGNTALYPYPSLAGHSLLENYNLFDLNFGYDGFVRDENSIWIKTQSGINPNDSVVRVSDAFRFLTVYGNNRNAYLKIKGIEFRYFGKPVLNSLFSSIDYYPAIVFDLRDVHHVYFDSCRFLFNTLPIYFGNHCNNITIQNSYFKHDVGKWSHAMIKKSSQFIHTPLGTISSSRARNVEFPAIFIQQSKSVVIRNNLFDGLNSGFESFVDVGLKEEVDIYNNCFIDNFDAIECDGIWTNLRVWNNEIIRPMAGISAAPPLIGPRYFYRNVFHGMRGRRNEQDDPYFVSCHPVTSNYMGQGIAIKTNPRYTGNISLGNLYFFNNTFHTSDTLGFVFTSWDSEWRKAIFINNTYSHTTSYPFFYFSLADNKNFQITSINDNYFSHNNISPIVKIKHNHGGFVCSDVHDVNNLESILRNISGSSSISIQNPLQEDPLFISTYAGGFELSALSPLIDAGVEIQGFHDFKGLKPDIGAKESDFASSTSDNLSQSYDVLVHPNPATDIIVIQLSSITDSVDVCIFNQLGQIMYQQKGLSGQIFVIEMGTQANGIYFIEVNIDLSRVIKKVVKVGF